MSDKSLGILEHSFTGVCKHYSWRGNANIIKSRNGLCNSISSLDLRDDKHIIYNLKIK